VTYEFGGFQLDAAARVLTRDGSPVPLPPKVTETLLVLVERAGRIVSKDELMAALWPDTFVEESNLAQNIFRLRKALGGESDQTFIATVPRRGYRFAHAVTTIGSPAHAEPSSTPTPPAIAARTKLVRAAAAVIILLAMAAGLTQMLRARDVPPMRSGVTTTSPARLTKITLDGRAFDPAISPDGRFVAYAVPDGETKTRT
jgi:DNA-binding winged helix-turn-helix (wHTH) protein